MRYYGGKEKLLPFMEGVVGSLNLPESPLLCDLFSGTAVVGRHFKQAGFSTISNDYLYFAKCLATARVGLNYRPRFEKLGCNPIEFLQTIPGQHGFFTEHYSPAGPEGRRYVSTENAMRIDSVRSQIFEWQREALIEQEEAEFLIAALLESVNRVSNVSGTYAAFLKNWDARSLKPLSIEEPIFTPGHGQHAVYHRRAEDLVAEIECDLLYLDPPYNERQYSSNYFLLDVIALGWFGSNPEVRGVTGMRDNSNLKSSFCSKHHAFEALSDLIDCSKSKYVVLSYSNEGIIEIDALRELLGGLGVVAIHQLAHRRYRAINHDDSRKNTIEFLFVLERS